MKLSYKSTTSWEKKHPTKDGVKIELDLKVEDIFRTDRVATELIEEREDIYQELFQLSLHSVVLPIIRETGVEVGYPGRTLEVTNDTNISSEDEWSRTPNNVIVQSRMNIDIVLNSSKSVNPIAALHCMKGGLADSIAQQVMNILNNAFLGEKKAKWSRNIKVREQGGRIQASSQKKTNMN